jgi:hypothetical protein
MVNAGKRSMIMRRITLMLLCSVGLWGCGAAAWPHSPTAQGYSFHASAVPNTIYLPSDLVSQQDYPSTATLLVHVHDVNEKPVEGVPVTVQLVGSQCQGVVTLSAQRAVTRQGRASLTLSTANTTGACQLAVRVDNVTQELWVTVVPPPDPLDLRR